MRLPGTARVPDGSIGPLHEGLNVTPPVVSVKEDVLRVSNFALVNFMPPLPTPQGCPHTPGGDLTLLLVPTPGAIDSCPIH